MTISHSPRLGAVPVKSGWEFRIFSGSAEKIELVLFDKEQPEKPIRTVELEGPDTDGIFSTKLREDLDGLLYAFHAHGPKNQFGNGNKLLLDPYVQTIGKEFQWEKVGYSAPLGELVRSEKFDWQGVKRPATPLSQSVIYEAHARGMTMLHPKVPPEERGTFLGLASPAIIDHLLNLGVTAVELLPVFYHLDERSLWQRGESNYWGYNPIAHFALHPRFSAQESAMPLVDQFKTFVREYHRAGIEVILDVVFNHSGEWSADGPAVCFRGLDNRTYYRMSLGHLVDWTGCGNTLNTDQPQVRRLICDALRYWADEMQVDGFRLDLASALFRKGKDFDLKHPLFDEILRDPILSKRKLIAEPWDATGEGYQVGRFPKPWSEWNDKFRDTVRRFWGGDGSVVGDFATRISGSSDLYAKRAPASSINFVTAHDGFTLRDLVSYSEKHNLENGHDGGDGSNSNHSFNCGVEGDTAEKSVERIRLRSIKNFLATLFLSNGVPMLLGGDELFRTQRGNNNPYCHDRDWNYFDWSEKYQLSLFIRSLTEFRKKLRWFGENEFFSPSDLTWYRADGREMLEEDWHSSEPRPLIAHYSNAVDEADLLAVFNPTRSVLHVSRPDGIDPGKPVHFILDTANEEIESGLAEFPCWIESSSMMLLKILR